jgi:uncharacterized protein
MPVITLPIAEGLFTWPGTPGLIGGSCLYCGTTTFPRQAACPRCTRTSIREVALASRGTLWSWTIQGFEPKAPYAGRGPFTPYGVGYVELAALEDGAAAVLVESLLTVADPGQLHIGDEMELVIVPFRRDPDGNELVTFAFRPASRTT